MSSVVLNASALNGLLRSSGGPAAIALERTALRVETAAKRFAPVDTGRLRASITTVMGEDSDGLVAYVGSNVQYAIYQEYGTRFQSGTPFLRPALDAARTER